MSIAAMNWAWTQHLNPTEKLVLMAISDHAGEDGTCYPGQGRLAEKCCVSRRTVIRVIQVLEDKGFLVTNHRSGNGEGRKSNIYQLNLGRLSDNLSQGQSDTHVTSKVTPMSPKPSDKPPDKKLRQRKTKTVLPDDLKLAGLMLGKIEELNPGHKKPNLEKWADTIRLMRDRDSRTHKEMWELFKWANNDNFWKTNILCPATLRKQWDQLKLKRNQANETHSNGNGSGQSRDRNEIHRDAYAEIARGIEERETGGTAIRGAADDISRSVDEKDREQQAGDRGEHEGLVPGVEKYNGSGGVDWAGHLEVEIPTQREGVSGCMFAAGVGAGEGISQAKSDPWFTETQTGRNHSAKKH